MASVENIFNNLAIFIQKDGQSDFASLLQISNQKNKHVEILNKLLQSIFKEIDSLVSILKQDEKILLSVKHQKLLRTSFQLITSFGIAPCLLPGVGIPLSKRCTTAIVLPCITINDEEKYELLVLCAEFFTRCYTIPVLKNIIITFHLCDYLAILIQLTFAPLKKPGIYKNFTMTKERYEQLSTDKKRFHMIYENLVSNCFQPTLMKELLVLTGATKPPPPAFVVRVIAKEMSCRLLAPGGLLSLMRCFLESYDSASHCENEWMKSDMICKLVTFKHGIISEDDYFTNISSQLKKILSLNNTHYLAPAVACAVCLYNKYPHLEPVTDMSMETFQPFCYDILLLKTNCPGTLILSPQEVENKINILDACVAKNELSVEILTKNVPVLVEVAVQFENTCSAIITKIYNILLKCLERSKDSETLFLIKKIMFGERQKYSNITIEKYEAGVAIKYKQCIEEEYPIRNAMSVFLQVFKLSDDGKFAKRVFDSFLQLFSELTEERSNKLNNIKAISEQVLLLQAQYACTLEVLIEISTHKNILSELKKDASSVFDFIENFLLKYSASAEDDCLAICVVLLKTLHPVSSKEIQQRCQVFIPVLEKVAQNESHQHALLFKEVLREIHCDQKSVPKSACETAISDVFDNCLPVRAHGIIELTKLIDAKDPETLSKKHYLFCMFQEQLKDQDSYIYLSAINGLAALGVHCTEDVLNELCKEYVAMSPTPPELQTEQEQNDAEEIKMKIGDVIVKVTKGLGEVAAAHKSVLLNAALCGCRAPRPRLRASALAALAALARALRYNMGSIIYEVLMLIWNTIETDEAVECRRAAVMVIASLLQGLGPETLVELKEQLLPIYRTLKRLYNTDDDDIVKLHAQIALEELNDTVHQLMLPELKMEKKIIIIDQHN